MQEGPEHQDNGLTEIELEPLPQPQSEIVADVEATTHSQTAVATSIESSNFDKFIDYYIKFLLRVEKSYWFKEAIKDRYTGIWNVLGIATLPVPTIWLLYKIHHDGLETNVPAIGDLHSLDHLAAKIFGSVLVTQAGARFWTAIWRRVGRLQDCLVKNTSLEIKLKKEFIENESVIDLAAYKQKNDDDKKLNYPQQSINYLFKCSNTVFFIRTAAIAAPFCANVVFPDKKGSVPVVSDARESGIYKLLILSWSFHYCQAHMDRSWRFIDILTNEQLLLIWLKDIFVDLFNTHDESAWQRFKQFFWDRYKKADKKGLFEVVGSGVGVVLSVALTITAFATDYFKNNGAEEKSKIFGAMKDYGGHWLLYVWAVSYVLVSTGVRLGAVIDAWRSDLTGRNKYNLMFTRFVPLLYVAGTFCMAFESVQKKLEPKVDFFRKPLQLNFGESAFAVSSTALNFSLTWVTRFFGRLFDYKLKRAVVSLFTLLYAGAVFLLGLPLLLFRDCTTHERTISSNSQSPACTDVAVPNSEESTDSIVVASANPVITNSYNNYRDNAASLQQVTVQLEELSMDEEGSDKSVEAITTAIGKTKIISSSPS